LWVGGTIKDGDIAKECFILRFHKPSKKWDMQINIPYEGRITEIVRHDSTLWLGKSGDWDNLVLSVDLSGLKRQNLKY
jgi:hypothetical protein